MRKLLTVKTYEALALDQLKKGQIHRIQVHVPGNPLGTTWKLPLIVAVGHEPGPTLGITAAVHGNELNGLSSIFKLFEELDCSKLGGILVAVPVFNLPGFLTKTREFIDGKDLNRYMPGKEKGLACEIYNHSVTSKIISNFDYLLDLHTASFGRENCLYVRAELDNPVCRTLAYLQNPHIIVNKHDEEGTLRAWANSVGIAGITIEIGNPGSFQHWLIDSTLEGIRNTLIHLKMMPGQVQDFSGQTLVCNSSTWVYSYTGGVVDVLPKLTQKITKGDTLARIHDVFGRLIKVITAEKEGVVIGRTINPVCAAGSRILHLGLLHPKT